ncbi:MAG: ligase-associated DNA damage response DEXH box helicase [Micavibrio aeruginosavorus]|uniref:Ligase-associated DNA damage response DEXH box helicase n=1 Tax=Micavibrio aeruginosavorus TaxID=349221 RepID=A0A2W4ZN88_9BACT|nr:MAG: ligase-associated DNA damage response DEXH box helicase [Micavibrio aeruginosavorus]
MAQNVHVSDLGSEAVKGKLEAHPLTHWLASKGWSWFPHQVESLKAAMEGKNVLICAPTGAGKTLAGFLPSFMDLHMLGGKFEGLHTLYISPLKALTVDVHRNIGKPIKELDLPISFETRTGDTPASKKARQKTKPPHMLMTTPESLALLLSYPEAGKYFQNLRYIIIDELHSILDSKRGDLFSLGMARLGTIAPKAQRIGLSATISDPETAARWLAEKNTAIIQAPVRTRPDITILKSKERIPWAGHMASYAMKEIYEEVRKNKMSIVFVNTRAQAELVFQNLWKHNHADLTIALHHGSLERELRRKVEGMMADGALDCVVATSSLDLGLDWAEVDLVVQIGAPKGISRLLQRIGRSNHRLNEPSKALLVPTNRFEYLECLAAKAGIAHNEIDGVFPKTGGLDVLAQHIFGTACTGPFDADQLYKEVITAWPYKNLTYQDFSRVLSFVINGGYALNNYEQYKRIRVNEDGLYELTSPRQVRLYRMNIGTIVESPMLKVKMGRRTLGTIEEFFINNLAPGDTFLFAGNVVRFQGLHEMTVMVSRTNDLNAKIPSYDGGKLPMSTHLSQRVRQFLEERDEWQDLPDNVRQWLEHQEERSSVPDTHRMLVEVFPRMRKHYIVAYTFAGRQANQTLGFLIMRRLQRNGAKPVSFVATDYAVTMTTLAQPQNVEDLFSVDLLGEELNEWLEDTPLIKRMFREAAVISGLIERRHPGAQKTGRQMTFSSDLIYDVLHKYEPDHILLRAARQDANSGLIDIGRLSDLLVSIQGKITVRHLKRVSPLAIPMILQIARENLSRKQTGEYYLEDLEQSLLKESGMENEE